MSEASLSQLAIYSARPTLLIDTRSFPKLTELMLGMEMSEQEGGMCSLELRVSNVASTPGGAAGFAFEDSAILKLGATVQVYAGDENAPQEIFLGKITGLEAEFSADGPPELVVLAEDVFQQARMARRTQLHENVTLADLAKGLASSLGLTPVITGLTENIGTQVQLNESDLAFLRRLLQRYDSHVQVVGKEMHVSPIGEVKRGQIELAMYSQLQEARVTVDLAHQATEVSITGWDPIAGQRITGRGTGTHLGPGAGRTGAAILQDTLGKRAEHAAHAVAVTSDEAQALADADFNSRARRFVCLEGVAEGNASLRVGAHVRITGMGPRFDNTYYVTQATHRFDLSQGYRTWFEATCAYWGG